MGVDRSDDFDVPSSSSPGSGGPDGRVQVEERDRFEYYDALRTEASQASWEGVAERFRADWAAHEARWPAEARKPADRPEDPEGSWRGDSGRFLDSAANAEVEERCERIAEAERNVVTPAMREIEACDPERRLVGLDHRLKGQDRIKDKVAETMAEQPNLTASEALADVSDTVRFTFRYSEGRYSQGVREDIERLEERGFELVRLKNFWPDAQYKGINSQWTTPDSGQRFEVQFHTQVSFEAKQLTHGAYERLRSRCADDQEEAELADLQREVSCGIPIPPDVSDIHDYRMRSKDAG